MKELALNVSDFCWMTAMGLCFLPWPLAEKIVPSGTGIGPGLAILAVGFIIMLPLTGPLALVAWGLDKIFSLDQVRKQNPKKF